MILPLPPSELKLFHRVNTDENADKKEIDPHEVIYDFFSTYHLKDVRKDLWELLKMALENRNIAGEHGQISNFIFLYEKLNDLITANHILNEANPKPQPEKEQSTDTVYT